MDNQTSLKAFHLVGFSSNAQKHPLLFIVFFFIYSIGVLWNIVIITLVFKDTHLHTPMYIFLCNLSFLDTCYTTITLPKLLEMLVTEKNVISSVQCFTQMFFFLFVGFTEILLLLTMAYDRYVAICNPLRYHLIINKEKCAVLLGGTWILGCANSIIITGFASKLSYCHITNIQHFFCDPRAMAIIFCADVGFNILLYLETFLFGLLPFLFGLTSYINIIISIFRIKSTDGRRKAFSTCTSHLTVLTLFYGSVVCVYIKPPSDHADILEQFFSVMYVAVTPMLNPLIYSLRNKAVKGALMRLLKLRNK